MPKVLIIEDEADLADLLSFSFKADGFETMVAYDGRRGLELAATQRPDLVILDLMLPFMNGLEVCGNLRKQEHAGTVPIIMVTARGEEVDRVAGFEVGADDYLVKPFSVRELLLRAKAVLRRLSKDEASGQVVTAGPIVIDISRHHVKVNAKQVVLTTTEFKLLLILAERIGRMQSREQLLTDVWGYSCEADPRTVDTHITRLRTKLGVAGDMIKTVRGFGYKLEAE